MSTYKPSFIFQSKISNEIDNTSTSKSSQADKNNTLGSTNPDDVSSISYVGQSLSFSYTSDNLGGGQPTSTTLANDPKFQKYAVLAAAGVPEYCPQGQSHVVDTDNSVICDFPSPNGAVYQFSDEDINSIAQSAPTILREAREEALQQSLNDADFYSTLDTLGSPESNIQKVIDDVKSFTTEILKDRNYTMPKKAEQANWILEQMVTALSIGDFPINEGFTETVQQLQQTISSSTSEVNDDSILNTVPPATTIGGVVQYIGSATVCPPGKVKRYYGPNNQFYECVCKINTVPCPDTDSCIECVAPAIAVWNPPTMFSPGGCECKCPEGLELHGSECREPCPPGTYHAYGLNLCVCRKTTGIWPFQKIEPVTGDDCPSGEYPDPNNNCECTCAGTIYTDPNNSSDDRCGPTCSGGKVYDWDASGCFCPSSGYCAEGETLIETPEGCSCSGSGTSSGSYSYSSLSLAEMSRIASHFGYKINHTVEFI